MSAKRNSTRQSRLVNRHKVPCGCLRGGGWLILVRDLEKASQRREYLSGAFGSWYFSTQNVLLPLTLPYPTAKEQGRSEGGNQAARPAWQMHKAKEVQRVFCSISASSPCFGSTVLHACQIPGTPGFPLLRWVFLSTPLYDYFSKDSTTF